ncbi:MAG: hypothetical protein II449_01995 [Prevotella sp.]|nr:hypothetical protein [Prevotella sp.]MBQ2167999.1 hypothetical protein [Prevotella sp.]
MVASNVLSCAIKGNDDNNKMTISSCFIAVSFCRDSHPSASALAGIGINQRTGAKIVNNFLLQS